MPSFNYTRITADLHTHTVFSDGCKTPGDVCAAALEIGLSHVAITDHDSLDGYRSLLQSEDRNASDLRVIPGVEISTEHDGRDIHMLGYFVDPEYRELDRMFSENRARREARACKMADNMAEDGYPVSGEAMRASGSTLNRTLLARMLVDCGAAENVDDAFRHLIGRRSKYYVGYQNVDAVEAIKLIVEAGGFPFIAHPAQYRVVDLIPMLKREGMVGLEAYYTLHSADQERDLVILAHDEGLGVSGGSDWHGDSTHGATLGGSGLDAGNIEQFLRVCGRA